ncbi:MAG: tetratricopeptide repeat protein [Terracidiphilus sp.]|jgi:TPR repeat protein
MNKSQKERILALTERLLARDRDDWRAVRELWQPLVDQGDLDAKACLAHLILWYMSAPERVDNQMREYLRDAAQSGHADAIYWSCRWGKEGDTEADHELLRSGELGSRGAQRDLGALHATGDWTGPKDPARGVYWYRLAAERGHDNAQYNLGFMYILGEGTESNVKEGLRWLHLSAMQGDWSARRLLADLYRNGYYGVPKDIEEAKRWEHLQSVAWLKLRNKRKRIRLDELRESY